MKKVIILSAMLLCLFAGGASAANINDFKTDAGDDTSAIVSALASAENVEIPSGEYYLKSLSVPANKKITGDAKNPPVLHVIETDNGCFLDMKSGSEISGVKIINDAEGANAINIKYALNVKLSDIEISGFEYGVYNDHGNNMTCDGLKIYNISNTGISTVYASDITVRNSIVQNCAKHGIQFWNNDEGKRIGGNLLFENNTVTDAANGGIWGSGGTGVIMCNNTVDNCGDVGLDLEYVKDAEIYENTAMRCANGGISCFMTCDGVDIHNNKVYNNRPEHQKDDYMAGIWLTYENSKYDYDTGNKNINIYDNFIYCIPYNGSYTREAIRICTRNYNEKNIKISNNTILGIPYRILFDVSGGLRYGYDSNMSFDANGSEYIINAMNHDIADGQYKNEDILYCDEDITSSFTVKNTVMKSGAAEACFYITKKSMPQGAKLLIEIEDVDGGRIITSKTLTPADINGEKIPLYYDRSGAENVVYRVSVIGSGATVKLSRIEVNMADFSPMVFIKTIDGTEFLNNSYCNLKTKLVFRRPADRLGIKYYIVVQNHSDNTMRQKISASWTEIGKEER